MSEKEFDLKYAEDLLSQLLFCALKLEITPSLKDTPKRMAKMYAELLSSVHKESIDINVRFDNEKKYGGIILSDLIQFWSVCEHHFLPFGGYGWIAYVPNQEFISGLSKLERALRFFSRKPQVQERLSMELLEFFDQTFKPKGTLIYLRAKHGCTQCRGVLSSNRTGMSTNVCSGVFMENTTLELKALEMIKISLATEGL